MRDVIIVGGGPAGLSAAIVLGRARRSVLLVDAGQPRNRHARSLHGYLGLEDIPPGELLQRGREQLRPYDTVELRRGEVADAARVEAGFRVALADGGHHTSRKLLLATGVVDAIPEVDGLMPLYGRSVHHCPYCDGWEWRDRPLAALGEGTMGLSMALKLTQWSRDVVLCTDGPAGLDPDQRNRLDRAGVPLREEPIERLEGRDGLLERIVFRSGPELPRAALFFNTECRQRSPLADRLEAEVTDKQSVKTGKLERTRVPGLYVAGDASREVQLVAVAAGEGVAAAFGIHEELIHEDLERSGSPLP